MNLYHSQLDQKMPCLKFAHNQDGVGAFHGGTLVGNYGFFEGREQCLQTGYSQL